MKTHRTTNYRIAPVYTRGLIIGLTGGIACGKTTVARLLAQYGADVIDLDEIGHQLLKKGSPVYDQIVETFGADILDTSGDINRAKLGNIVFHDSDCRMRLNDITHPAIIEESWAEARRLAKLEAERVVVIDAPLLIEASLQDTVDFIIVVVSGEEKQLQRLIHRSVKQGKSLSVSDARARIHAQMPLAEKVKYADFIIENNSGMAELELQVKKLWKLLKKKLDVINFLKYNLS